MTRIELATHIVGYLRLERNAPMARYAFVLAAASKGEAGATVREIADAIGDTPHSIATGVSKVTEGGFLRRIPGSVPFRYTPTDAGLALIKPLIQPAPVPA